MATVSNWNPYGVNLNLTANPDGVTRTSATEYKVNIKVSWSCSGTWNHMKVSSGGASKFLYEGSGASDGTSGTITGTYSISGNGSATKTITVTFYNMNPDNHNIYKTKNVTFTVTVPAWTSYEITYNANGGSGGPTSSQTKWKSQTLVLSTEKPTRDGHTFLGWSTSKTATTATYPAGGNYTANAAATLYAVWRAYTYRVTYDANGGIGAPASQTKTYGKALKLSDTKPTLTNYTFLGWSTSKTATTATYSAGGNYTANAAATLYAVWELAYVRPRINLFRAYRASINNGKPIADDNSELIYVEFTWDTDFGLTGATITWENSSESVTADLLKVSPSEHMRMYEGTLEGYYYDLYPSHKFFDTDETYTITVTIQDSEGYTTQSVTVPGSKFAVDFKAGGTGVAFGKPAELDDVADFAFKIKAGGGFINPVLGQGTDLNNVLTPNTYVGENISSNYYLNCPIESGTFTLEVLGAGTNNQVLQRLTQCVKNTSMTYERVYHRDSSGDWTWGDWVCVSDYAFSGKLLWDGSSLSTGGYYMTAGHTVELSEPVSKQRNGIVLVFSLYDSETQTAKNQEMFEFFIPKYSVAKYPGSGRNFNLCGSFGNGVKYLYLHDDKITGNDRNNNDALTIGGITYDNTRYVLRCVIGV